MALPSQLVSRLQPERSGAHGRFVGSLAHVRSLEGKAVLITGGGTGIGAAAARRFAALGAGVVITGRRPGPLHEVADEIGVVAVVGDTSDESHCVEAVRAAVNRFGGLDILVPNAAVEVFGSVTEISLEDWRMALRIDLDGVMIVCRAAIPEMQRRGGGAIVVVSSALGLNASAHFASYVTSKTALIGLTKAMAMDYGPDNIRVNVLCPGWVRTELAERAIQKVADERGVDLEEMIRRVTSFYPLRRIAHPDEIASCIEFVAGPASSFVTGARAERRCRRNGGQQRPARFLNPWKRIGRRSGQNESPAKVGLNS